MGFSLYVWYHEISQHYACVLNWSLVHIHLVTRSYVVPRLTTTCCDTWDSCVPDRRTIAAMRSTILRTLLWTVFPRFCKTLYVHRIYVNHWSHDIAGNLWFFLSSPGPKRKKKVDAWGEDRQLLFFFFLSLAAFLFLRRRQAATFFLSNLVIFFWFETQLSRTF